MSPLRASLVALLALSGCFWTDPPNDDGDEAFVAQAIETVLGRKPLGSAEVRALVDVARTHGREAVLVVLFDQPEYVTYWSNVLADDLEVQRSGAMQADPDCTAPGILDDVHDGALAAHLAAGSPEDPFCYFKPLSPLGTFDPEAFSKAFDAAVAEYKFDRVDKLPVAEPIQGPIDLETKDDGGKAGAPSEPNLERWGSLANNRDYATDDLRKIVPSVDLKRWNELYDLQGTWECPPFNLTDVVQAAVRADRIDAALRGYLPILAAAPGTGDQRGAAFLDVYVDRDPTCMSCHTATWSKTDPRPRNGNWDRFAPVWYGLPVPLDAEGTVFSYDDGATFVYGGDGGPAVRQRVNALFRDDNVGGGLAPWGMDDACVTDPARGVGLTYPLGAGPTGQFAGVGPGSDLGAIDLVYAWSDATASLGALSFEVPDWAGYRAAKGASLPATPPSCTGCHPGGLAPDLNVVIPTMTDERLFSVIRNGSGAMRPRYDNDADAWDAVEWLRANYPETPALQMQDRNHGWVFLSAAATVHQIVDEVFGEDLAMNHGFSRNPDQSRALSSLTMTFLERFSLQDVLTEILLSDGFNRAPPREAATDPYSLEMLPYPEAAVRPGTPVPLGADANSEGDYVHRVNAAGLVHQVHAALGWPEVPVAGWPTAYPSAALLRSVGRYSDRTAREQAQFGVVSYLTWEQQVGTCQKPAEVYAGDVDLAPGEVHAPIDPVGPEQWVDWIDRLAEAAPARGLTWGELAIAIEDRLLADPVLAADEEARIATLWGVNLADRPGDDGAIDAAEEDALRAFCGVLLTSPHFVLRGTRLAEDLPTKLPDPVCLPDEPCGESAHRDEAEAVLLAVGYDPKN